MFSERDEFGFVLVMFVACGDEWVVVMVFGGGRVVNGVDGDDGWLDDGWHDVFVFCLFLLVLEEMMMVLMGGDCLLLMIVFGFLESCVRMGGGV